MGCAMGERFDHFEMMELVEGLIALSGRGREDLAIVGTLKDDEDARILYTASIGTITGTGYTPKAAVQSALRRHG